jgi:uracil-DNA glycosylase
VTHLEGSEARHALLAEITRCPVVERCKAGDRSDPCFKVVSVQEDVPLRNHQVPEPWNGLIEEARLLFVSSNPSINSTERYPVWASPLDERIDFFEHRFGGGRTEWTTNRRTLQQDGTYSTRTVSYWNAIHQRAVELLGSDARAGIDYAITEVVRCKSADNYGVREARTQCAERYLRRTLELSPAQVIVIIGEEARRTVAPEFGGPGRREMHGPVRIGRIDRFLVSLGAPNSSDPQKVANCLRPREVEELRRLLRSRRHRSA